LHTLLAIWVTSQLQYAFYCVFYILRNQICTSIGYSLKSQAKNSTQSFMKSNPYMQAPDA